MKKNLILLISVLTLCFSCKTSVKEELKEQSVEPNMQSFTVTEETIKKDMKGNIISSEEFQKLMSTGKYILNPKVEDGKMIEAQIVEADDDQLTMLKKMKANQDKINYEAPDFDVVDIEGNSFKLSDLKDKTIVLTFWFTNCKPCIEEIPILNQLVEENRDVIFLGMATDKKEIIETFLEKHPFKYTIIANSSDISSLYEVVAFPTHIIIKNGKVVYKKMGVTSDIKMELQNAIEGKKEKQKNDKTSKDIMLTSDSDIRNEKGEKLEMMKAVEMINSQKYSMENTTDKEGNQYILIREN
ncbi:thioredoxin-like protein YneN [Flavobacteriaceae bacterium UJ101]|nr:thioredoxin-like protein YneN [Flavobacteriaceae bacterium UJ101]